MNLKQCIEIAEASKDLTRLSRGVWMPDVFVIWHPGGRVCMDRVVEVDGVRKFDDTQPNELHHDPSLVLCGLGAPRPYEPTPEDNSAVDWTASTRKSASTPQPTTAQPATLPAWLVALAKGTK
jgi:hypothetical protein